MEEPCIEVLVDGPIHLACGEIMLTPGSGDERTAATSPLLEPDATRTTSSTVPARRATPD